MRVFWAILILVLHSPLALAQVGDLMTAINGKNVAEVKAVLYAGADLEQEDENGNTALINATYSGQLEVVQLLLDYKADPNHKNKYDIPPLAGAISAKSVEMCNLLIDKGARVNISTSSGMSLLAFVVMQVTSNPDLVPFAKLLIDNGADVNSSHATLGSVLQQSFGSGSTDLIKMLISEGADPNGSNLYYGTHLHQTVTTGNIEVARLLCESKAKLTGVNGQGQTALQYAALMNKPAFCALFVSFGADPKKGDPSAFKMAKDYGYTEVLEALKKKNATGADAKVAELNSELFHAIDYGRFGKVKALIAKGAQLECRNTIKNTPLLQAIMMTRADIASYFLDLGAATNPVNVMGNNALLQAAQVDEAYQPLIVELVQRVLDSLDIEFANTSGETALILAARTGNIEMLQVLLKAGANKSVVNSSDKNAFDEAVYAGKPVVACYLASPSGFPLTTLSLVQNVYLKDFPNRNEKVEYWSKKSDELLKQGKDSPDEKFKASRLMGAARAKYQSGARSEAHDMLESFISQTGANGEILKSYDALLYFMDGEINKYETAKSVMAPGSIGFKSLTALEEIKAGEWNKAIAHMKALYDAYPKDMNIGLDPAWLEATVQAAELSLRKKDFSVYSNFYMDIYRLEGSVWGGDFDVRMRAYVFYDLMFAYGFADTRQLKGALVSYKSVYGIEHHFYWKSLIALAKSYRRIGEFSAAALIHDFLESRLGKHPSLEVELLTEKSAWSRDAGDFETADQLLVEAQELINTKLGINHPFHSNVSKMMAKSSRLQGKYDEALTQLVKVKDLVKINYGERSEEYLGLEREQAVNLMLKQEFDEAEAILLGVLKKSEKQEGEVLEAMHFKLLAQEDLALLFYIKGEYQKSVSSCIQAIYSNDLVLGKNNPRTIPSTIIYSKSMEKLGKTEESIKFCKEAIETRISQLKNSFPALTEREKELLYNKASYDFAYYYDLALRHIDEHPELAGEVLDLLINWKGVILSSLKKERKHIMTSKDEELKREYRGWKRLKQEIVNLENLPVQQRKDANLDSLKVQMSRLEKSLALKSAVLGDLVSTKEYSWKDLKTKLKDDEALLEFVRINSGDDIKYACIIYKSDLGEPLMIEVPEGENMETRYLGFYLNMIKNKLKNKESFKHYWAAVEPHLQDIKNVYVVPDGVYNQINLNTIAAPDEKYLADKYRLIYLTSTRDLLVSKRERGELRNGKLFGRPTYRIGSKNANPPAGDERSIETGKLRGWFRSTEFTDLPGTEVEVESISDILEKAGISTEVAMKEEAIEEKVKAVKNPSILHLATHGFFIDAGDTQEEIDEYHKILGEVFHSINVSDPMLRSGLLLAGATDHLENPTMGGEDGVLTAYEVMNMDLDETSIVVLSACETGKGELRAGEGVYGLQRALKVAGVETIVMSLWKVSDQATKRLMTLFYQELMVDQDIARAFRAAQLKMKEEYPDPFYWGAFVLIGNP